MDDASARTPQIPPLSEQQWQGLARLADMLNAAPALAAPMSEGLEGLLRLSARYDLPRLSEALLETGEALRDSGLLRFLSENATLIAETLQLLLPLAGAAQAKLDEIPLREFKQDLARLHRLLDKADLLAEYSSQHLAGPLAEWSVEAADFAQREELAESLKDLLQTLSRLHRNGSLAWLREMSDYAGVREQQRLLSGLADAGVETLGGLPERAQRLMKGVESAMQDAAEDAENLGGMKGLLHLLRDPEVQRGLRTLAVMPYYLEHPGSH
jgi:uncharacterized protein YjgD (DUF1641 family)